MHARWLSPRSTAIHLLAIAWVAGCVLAAYWQVGRAEQGNTFSYLYAIEWPALALVGVWVWWQQMRTTPESRRERSIQRDDDERAALARFDARRDRRGEDLELAAYNDYLEKLAVRDRSSTAR